MPTGGFQLYDPVLKAMAGSSLPPLVTSVLTAVLLRPGHQPDMAGHATYADILADEISGQDYRQLRLTGGKAVSFAGGAGFTCDPLHWGDPVSLPPIGYMALVFGLPGALKATSTLLGVMALAPGGAVEAVRGAFSISPPVDGWFHLSRS